MPKNDIGGFFVSLGLNIDKNSFDTGNRLIDGVGNSFNKLIGSARNAAVVLAGMAIATGAVETKSGQLANEIGISTEALELWKATAKIAGADANGLVSAMSGIANVLQRMEIDGAGLEDLTKRLGELNLISKEGIDLENLLNLSPDQLVKEVLDTAQKSLKAGAARSTVLQVVKDIIGEEGEKLFIDLDRRGISISQALTEANNRTYTNNETNANAQEFMTEVRLLKQASENMTKLLGSEVANQMTEYLQVLNKWIDDNGEKIASGISTIAEGVGKLVGKFVDFITDEDTQDALKTAGEALVESSKGALETSKNLVTNLAKGDVAGATQALTEGFQTTVVEPTDKVAGIAVKNNEELSTYQEETGQSNTETVVNAGVRKIPGLKWVAHGTDWLLNKTGLMSDAEYAANTAVVTGKKMKDGIMRPDGTVTQVAPDDWVIAARNLGDVARAFQPDEERQLQNFTPAEQDITPKILQNNNIDLTQNGALNELARHVGMLSATFMPQKQAAVSGGDYTINQTFNISGGNDMPQVIRQQAYRGTQEGLLEVMNESSRRLQLMSGTR